MKTRILVPLALVLVVAGCQTELAQQPYGPKEQQWEKVIKDNYPDWNPPSTVPPDRMSAPPSGPAVIVSDNSEVVEVPLETAPENTVPETNVTQPPVQQPPAGGDATEFQTYTVVKGDTLWKIAKRFYGSGVQWKRIYGANQDVISNPDKIRAGMEIKIPASQ